MKKNLFSTLAAAVLCMGGLPLQAADKANSKDLVPFGSVRAMSAEQARAQAEKWLKSQGKVDDKAVQAIWDKADQSVVDRVADTLVLGNADAAKALAEARNADGPAPQTVPALVKDLKLDPFFRANLSLAYGKALSNRRIYEEAYEALKNVQPEQVVDPAALLFHKAVAEHSLLLKDEGLKTCARLIDDMPEAPDRYRQVTVLMYLDMHSWKAKNLGEIARLMKRSEDRLELARAGSKTQAIQKSVVARLDEIIKKMENDKKNQGDGSGNGGGCPGGGECPGGQPGDGKPGGVKNPTSGQKDSYGGNASGPGDVIEKQLKQMAEAWGKLPEKDRANAMTAIMNSFPPEHRPVIEAFFKKASTGSKD